MYRSRLILFVVVPALTARVFLLQPRQAQSEDAKVPSTEIKVDNFTFTPETLTVSQQHRYVDE